MKNLVKCLLIFLLAFAFYGSSFYLPWVLNPDGTASVAQAAHKPSHDPKGKPPPTVSELPIEVMIPVGFTMILISGGILFLIKKRNRQNT